MSKNLDLQGPMLKSALAGGAAMSLYMFYSYLNRSYDVSSSEPMTKDQTINQVITALKKELRENFPIEMPRDPEDGLIEKEFFIKMHTLIYKYKKYG